MRYIYKTNPKRSAEANFKKSGIYKIVAMLLILSAVFMYQTSSGEIYGVRAEQKDSLGMSVAVNSSSNGEAPLMLYPGGMPFGVKMKTRGLIVTQLGEVESGGVQMSPCADAGIKAGDVIVRVGGKEVNSVEQFSYIINKSQGAEIIIEVSRNTELVALCVRPVLSDEDNCYKAGLYVRDNTAGIGTVTYIEPDTLNFAGLGHGICDGSTGNIMPLLSGEVCSVVISRVVKGREGRPGELRGCLSTSQMGVISKNCQTGVYGRLDSIDDSILSTPIEVATKDQVRSGKAHIICTVDCGAPEKYEIEITGIKMDGAQVRNYCIKVTDKKLLEKTGGIVQGMSGSPIIQDGRLIGAVTHVLLDDPTSGYGIFIGNMLGNMPG